MNNKYSIQAPHCDQKYYETNREMGWPAGLNIMLVFDGSEHLELSNTIGVGFVFWQCLGIDEPVASQDCGTFKPIKFSGKVETDDMYITARHKGHPEIVASEKRKGKRQKPKRKHRCGTLTNEKPPVFI